MKKTFFALALSFCALTATAQSQSFLLGKWTEIRNSILKTLYTSYVDSLPVDRIERAAVDAMLESLDPYTMYVPEEENKDFQLMVNNTYGGIGSIIYKPEIDGPVIIDEPYAGSPSVRAGIHCADEILEIDGLSTIGLSVSESSSRMKGEPGTVLTLKVRDGRSGEVSERRIVREQIHIPNVPYYGMVSDDAGYIALTGFTEGASDEVREAALALKKNKGLECLVLDLRGNGGGLLVEAINVVSLFVPKGSHAVSVKGADNRDYYTTMTPVDTKIPLIVLIDGGSASASEIVAGALQDLDRATIMGQRSYGKGLVQSIMPLPYGGQLKLTTSKYYIPSGRCIQAIDYSHRNIDGRVEHIPDSLTSVFHTAHGRPVRDGGGITPDVKLDTVFYSRLSYSVVLYGVADHFAMRYFKAHPTIASPADFHLSDADYEDFIEYAKTQEFDCRSAAKAYYDKMLEELRRDGLAEGLSEELEALGRVVDMEKEQLLRSKKDEIIPFIEEEIVVRYYYQSASYQIRLRNDVQLLQALSSPLISVN